MADPIAREWIKQLANALKECREILVGEALWDGDDSDPFDGLEDNAFLYLATPEPAAGPTDEELEAMLYHEFSTSTGHGTREDPIGFARAVLARYGHQPPQPIPLDDPPGPCPASGS